MVDEAKAAEKRRLAEALRANLRRRKTAAKSRDAASAQKNVAPAAPDASGDDGGKG